MGAPIPEAHPAELVLAVEALHVVAPPVLFDANVTLGAVLHTGNISPFDIISNLGPFGGIRYCRYRYRTIPGRYG